MLRLAEKTGRGCKLPESGTETNWNNYLHCLVLDGVHRCSPDGKAEFVDASPLTDKQGTRAAKPS